METHGLLKKKSTNRRISSTKFDSLSQNVTSTKKPHLNLVGMALF